jgi:hypothetical protein
MESYAAAKVVLRGVWLLSQDTRLCLFFILKL